MININGEDWRVLLVSANHPQLTRSDGTWTLGACDDYMKSIYLYEGLTPCEMRRVLAHELTHAAMFSYNVELGIQQKELFADLIATYGQEIVCKTNIFFKRIKENREAL